MAGLFTQAKESIDIVIDEIVIDPLDPKGLVSKIIESLLEARKTGVRVRVVLEDTTSPRNFTAYRTLLEGGIDVYFDTSRLLVNSRAVVVDSATCVIGGLSWAPDSWRDDHTLSVVIDSEEMAGTVEGSISKLLLTEAAPLMEIEAEGMLIPNDFLLLKKFGMRFIDGRAEEAFDLYLLIIKEAQEKSSSELLFDHEGWGRTLSLEKKFFREFESDQERSQYYNSRLKKALGVLDGRYGLVDFHRRRDRGRGWRFAGRRR